MDLAISSSEVASACEKVASAATTMIVQLEQIVLVGTNDGVLLGVPVAAKHTVRVARGVV